MHYYLIILFVIILVIYIFRSEISLFVDLIEDAFKVTSDLYKLNGIKKPIITIFGGASMPNTNKYYKDAFELSNKLADKGYVILTGGGPGIMESANCGAIKNSKNNKITSVSTSTHYFSKYEELNKCSQVNMLHDRLWGRKAVLINKSSAFIVFPGGIGTADELFNILTLMANKLIPEKHIILYDKKYWLEIINWMKKSTEMGIISKKALELITIKDSIDDIDGIFIAAKDHK